MPSGGTKVLGLRLFQQRDLPTVIRNMLHRSPEHEEYVVRLARNALFQSRLRESRNFFDELRMSAAQSLDRLLPVALIDLLNVAKVLWVAKLERFPMQSADHHVFPSRNVQHQLPNAMRGLHGTCSGFGCVNTVKDIHECRTVPWVSFEGQLELVDGDIDLRHWKLSPR